MSGKLLALIKSRIDPGRYGWSGHFRWPLLSIAVGLVSGLGAILFEELLRHALYYFLHLPTGFVEPAKGMGATTVASLAATRSWLFLIIPTLGGLISGLLVYLIAPEAEGHGTDAMIEAFHLRGGFIRKRVPFVKILASASDYRQWRLCRQRRPHRPDRRRLWLFPGHSFKAQTACIGAYWFWQERPVASEPFSTLPWAQLSSRRRSSTGRRNLNSRPSYPASSPPSWPLPSSTNISDGLPCSFLGRWILRQRNLLPYAIFGVVCALVGYVYVKVFYDVARDRFFNQVPIPRTLKPALGGLMLGVIAFCVPQVMDGGYGWVQAALEGKIFWGMLLLVAIT